MSTATPEFPFYLLFRDKLKPTMAFEPTVLTYWLVDVGRALCTAPAEGEPRAQQVADPPFSRPGRADDGRRPARAFDRHDLIAD